MREGGTVYQELVEVSRRGLRGLGGDGPAEEDTADDDDQVQVSRLGFNEPPGEKGADEEKRGNCRPWGP